MAGAMSVGQVECDSFWSTLQQNPSIILSCWCQRCSHIRLWNSAREPRFLYLMEFSLKWRLPCIECDRVTQEISVTKALAASYFLMIEVKSNFVCSSPLRRAIRIRRCPYRFLLFFEKFYFRERDSLQRRLGMLIFLPRSTIQCEVYGYVGIPYQNITKQWF